MKNNLKELVIKAGESAFQLVILFFGMVGAAAWTTMALFSPDKAPSPFEVVQVSGMIAGFTTIGTAIGVRSDLKYVGQTSVLATVLLIIAGLLLPVARIWPDRDLLGLLLTGGAVLALTVGGTTFFFSLALLVGIFKQTKA